MTAAAGGARPALGGEEAARRIGLAERILRRLDWTVVRRLDGILQGNYRSLFYGQGLDLAEVREYQPEDDVRYMDWNVTARMGEPYVRQYLEDREITAWLLLDVSASIDFGTANAKKADLLVDASAVLARLLARHGNRIGAVLFSGGVDLVVPPGQGDAHVLSLIHQTCRPDRRSSPGATDLGAVLDAAAKTVRRRSLVFVVSDFFSAPGWEAALGRLARRHEVLAVWLRDPREEELPDVGPVVLEDAETGEQVYVPTQDRSLRQRFAVLATERRRRIEATFARQGVDVLSLSTDGDLVRDMVGFTLRRREARRRSGGRPLAAQAAVAGG